MKAEDVIELYKLLEEKGIEVWIDGGWGIDALLEKQTRPHNDLDIAIKHKDTQKLRLLLSRKGFKEKKRDSEWNFVLYDIDGREIDVHTFTFDDKGNSIEGIAYTEESLTGTGTINGQTVKCISPEYVIKFHVKYQPKDKDLKDIRAICYKFGIELPENYKKP